MKRKKKFLAFVLAGTMLLGIGITAHAQRTVYCGGQVCSKVMNAVSYVGTCSKVAGCNAPVYVYRCPDSSPNDVNGVFHTYQIAVCDSGHHVW